MTKLLVVACALFTLSACTKKEEAAPTDTPAAASTLSPEELVTKGKRVYESQCTSCHAKDPKVSGPLGPDVAGSSQELISARVLTATYPEGYKPKRPTKTMAALPFLKNDIPALTAYLESVK